MWIIDQACTIAIPMTLTFYLNKVRMHTHTLLHKDNRALTNHSQEKCMHHILKVDKQSSC